VFLRDGDRVFHTYTAYARGVDNLGFISNFLDLTPLGRQEEWEEPKGRKTALGAPAGSVAVRYHDEYRGATPLAPVKRRARYRGAAWD
jgi:predicted dithiol-disulfide oxidoreductase (DUF899 family)